MCIILMVDEPNGTSYFFPKDMQKKRENLGTVFYRNLISLWVVMKFTLYSTKQKCKIAIYCFDRDMCH